MIQSEFLFLIRITLPELAHWCSTHSFKEIMDLKKDIQKALSVYSRHHKMDAIQEKALSIITKIEKWCRDAFVKREMARIISGNSYNPKNNTKIKSLARKSWEEFNKKMSY